MRINNDNDLRKYIPNALVTVTGEQSLFDKIRVELEISDSWFERTFGMESYPDTVTEKMSDMACKVVASDAFVRAIPSLDLVLTPNGFGVVSNNTIAPASKERVERLIESMEISRDFAIEELLHDLMLSDVWKASEQGGFFLTTLFQTPMSLPYELRRNKAWDNWLKYRTQLILTEQELAEKYISSEVYGQLRGDVNNPDYACIVKPLQSIELHLLQGNPLPYKFLISLVDHIRKDEETFPGWQTSKTAELYQSHSYNNQKDAAGYWW